MTGGTIENNTETKKFALKCENRSNKDTDKYNNIIMYRTVHAKFKMQDSETCDLFRHWSEQIDLSIFLSFLC